MTEKFDIDGLILEAKRSIKNFDANAILRGAQLTVVGAYRALQNPGLFKYEHYRQAAIAVGAGIAIRLLIAAPIFGIKAFLWLLSFMVDFEHATWDDKLVGGLDFIANSVLQVPFFLMSLMRYITPTLDHMFMDSLAWVDQTYVQKHKTEDPKTLRAMYYPNLRLYSTHGDTSKHKAPTDAALAFLFRFGRRAAISLAIYMLSYLPLVGRFVLPAASFYTFNRAVGPLEPYFSRIRFSKEQKKLWFRDREGLLFGFGVGFYIFLRIPLLGVLIYGIAEASTAFLITKITDPPPPPTYSERFAESQVRWTNKHEFLHLPLSHIDLHNVRTEKESEVPLRVEEVLDKKFS
ncbi:hypothetical protein MMC11_001958 [Xylographa trunciseda]|nr:hypothetical protein [Xylographa trunciseda]